MEEAEINDDRDRERREDFTSKIKGALGARMEGLHIADDEEPDVKKDYLTPSFEPYEDDTSIMKIVPEPDNYSTDAYDKLVSARITLPVSGVNQQGQVKQCNHDLDGNNIGKHHPDMSLNATMYEIQFDDGHTESYTANRIAENIYEQLDDEGNKFKLIKEIIEQKEDNTAIPKEAGTFTLKGRTHQKKTTRGCSLCILWKNSSTLWEPLKDLKESNTLEVAEYAVMNGIQNEPTFTWWVPFTLK